MAWRKEFMLESLSDSSCSLHSDQSKGLPAEFSDGPPVQIDRSSSIELKNQLDTVFTWLQENIGTFVKDELKRYRSILDSGDSGFFADKEDEEQGNRQAFLKITNEFLRNMEYQELAERLQRMMQSPGPGSEQPQKLLDSTFKRLEENIMAFVIDELKRFHRVLASEYSDGSVSEEDEKQSSREAFLKITLNFLRRMKQEQLSEHLQSKCSATIYKKLKRHLQHRFCCVFEGITKAGNPTLVNDIYTELYITEGGAAGVSKKHNFRQLKTQWKPAAPETTITDKDIFSITHRDGLNRIVLTKGVAGIGKTMLTQKFILDWAEGKANQDIQVLFPVTFRELNEHRDRQFSLVGLLHHYFGELGGLCNFEHLKVAFVFDGLDECRLPLDFTRTKVLTEATESSSVDVLLVNLIRGTLLPSACLWITTRPAAANMIPGDYISKVTEVQGFADPQKEIYFQKKFRIQQDATTVISHIKKSHILYIMCHSPIFCWIILSVLNHMIQLREQLPQTITQMYIHFLVILAKVKNFKYNGSSMTDPHWTPETRKMIESLGKLAFEQLQKGNTVFFETDLRECGLEPTSASVYSGVFTQVFREVPGLYQDKVYCFIHLSVQEFLAALHVHQTFFNTGTNLLLQIQTFQRNENLFYCSAIDQALHSPNRHLDLFLRFLLGLSLPTNQSLLQGLLSQKRSSSLTNQMTVLYIHQMLNEDLSAESSMNLIYCLNELNDCRLIDEIKQIMKDGCLNPNISPAQWSAVAYVLLQSELEEFDLKKYCASENVLLRLLPAVKASSKAILNGCDLSSRCCGPLSSVLSSSTLKHLDLSNNNLQDSGVVLLCPGLKNPCCKLEALILSNCNLSWKSCGPLSSVLSSSTLKHLDLSNNNLQDSGVELLCSGLQSLNCSLGTLKLSNCEISEEGGSSMATALDSSHSRLKELDLRNNKLGPFAEKQLKTLLEDPHCSLDTLRLETLPLTITLIEDILELL